MNSVWGGPHNKLQNFSYNNVTKNYERQCMNFMSNKKIIYSTSYLTVASQLVFIYILK
jgi:hypothetical protein